MVVMEVDFQNFSAIKPCLKYGITGLLSPPISRYSIKATIPSMSMFSPVETTTNTLNISYRCMIIMWNITSEELEILEPGEKILHDFAHVGLEVLNLSWVLNLGHQP